MVKTKEEREKSFNEKFKGWILQDNEEFYRSFEIIMNFLDSEIIEALKEQRKEFVDRVYNELLPTGEVDAFYLITKIESFYKSI